MIEQALGPSSGVPPKDNFPQSYVPEDCESVLKLMYHLKITGLKTYTMLMLEPHILINYLAV
jgi:hypothetical protein